MSDRMLTKSLSNKKRYIIKYFPKRILSLEKISQASKIRRISKNDLMIVKKLLKKFPSITNVVHNVDSFNGVVKLLQLTKRDKFANSIDESIKNDHKIASYHSDDLGKLGRMNQQAIEDMNPRLELIRKNIDQLEMSPDDKVKLLGKIFNSPETYSKFARSYDCMKNGFTPNAFSKILEEKGYSKTDLTKLMSYVHLPSSCMTDEEWEFTQKARSMFAPVQEGVKVIHKNEIEKYLNDKYDGIVGFVADEALYQTKFNRADLALSVLRLDYPSTRHFINDSWRTSAVYFFGKEVGEKCIPPIQREITVNSKGEPSNNAPNNPLTGNGFTSARNNMIIPEFEIDFNDNVKLKDCQMILGYFDNKGSFHPQHAYMQNKWVSVEAFFEAHKEIKTTDLDRSAKEPIKLEQRPDDRKYDEFER